MKLWCKVSYEAEFNADDYIEEDLLDGYTKEQSMEAFLNSIEGGIIGSIDGRADNKFYVPYERKFEYEWRND